MKKQQDQLKSVLETFVDFIRRKVVEDFRHVFGNFEVMSLSKAEKVDGSKGGSSDLKMVNICSPGKSLSLWLSQITEDILVGQSLYPFFVSPHTIGSIGPSMKIVMDYLKQLTPQNINVCEIVERSLTPIILKQVLKLFDEVIRKGSDSDSNLQGSGLQAYNKKQSNEMDIKAFILDLEIFNILPIKEVGTPDELLASPGRYKVIYLDSVKG